MKDRGLLHACLLLSLCASLIFFFSCRSEESAALASFFRKLWIQAAGESEITAALERQRNIPFPALSSETGLELDSFWQQPLVLGAACSFLFCLGLFLFGKRKNKQRQQGMIQLLNQEEAQETADLAKLGKECTGQAAAFEQEQWNMPGFQDLWRPFALIQKKQEGPSHKKHREESNAPLSYAPWEHYDAYYNNKKKKSYPDLYQFSDASDYQISGYDFQSFLKEMLISLSESLQPCVTSLCMKDKQGDYHLVLQRSGNLFVTERKAKLQGPAWAAFIKRIEQGQYIAFTDSNRFAFPLISRFALLGNANGNTLGFLHFECKTALRQPELMIEELWYKIRRYGERLLQLCLYEEASVDSESRLWNGLRFQEDMSYETAQHQHSKNSNQLLLLELGARPEPGAMIYVSQALREVFPLPAKLYRIGEKLLAILTSEQSHKKRQSQLEHFRSALQKRRPIAFRAGMAAFGPDACSSQDCFRKAYEALAA